MVVVQEGTLEQLPYADNMVNLLVSENLGDISLDEVNRALVPGGVACVRRGAKWTRTVKELDSEMDEWTHWLHDPTGNAVGRDRVVGPPRKFQWVAGPLWSRHHNTVPGVSVMEFPRMARSTG